MTDAAIKPNLRSRLLLMAYGLKPEDIKLPPFRKVSIPPDGYFYKRIEMVQSDDKVSIREVTRSHRTDDEIASDEIVRVPATSDIKKMTRMVVLAAIHQARLDKRIAERWRITQAAQQKKNREKRLL